MDDWRILYGTRRNMAAPERVFFKKKKKNGQQFDDLPIQSNGMANLIELNGAWNFFLWSCPPAQKKDIDDAYKGPSSDEMVPPQLEIACRYC
jgi:hypothetical protein